MSTHDVHFKELLIAIEMQAVFNHSRSWLLNADEYDTIIDRVAWVANSDLIVRKGTV